MTEKSSQDSSSFLIRLWREPREGSQSGPVRCYVRNLKTGEELYPEDPGTFMRLLANHGVRASWSGSEKNQVLEPSDETSEETARRSR